MPVSFEIYKQGRRLTDYAVRGASVMGPESIPQPGRVAFEEGLLHVDTGEAGDEAIGTALLWDAGDVGAYLLETTRLPPRQRPYILNVELARHRLMKLVHKQEDWNLFDFPRAEAPLAKVKKAQATFADALAHLHDPSAAANLADEALSLAIEASEELALLHAELLLLRRRHMGIPRALFGIRADLTVRNGRYRETLSKNFDYAIVPLPWKLLQPEEDVFDTAAADEMVEFLARSRVPTIAGPLVDLTDNAVPDWLYIYEHDFDTLRDLAFEYVKSVTTRYRRVIKHWNVVAGLHAATGFGLSFEQMIELTRLLVAQVKTILPQAKTFVTIRLPYGEYLANPQATMASPAGMQTGVPPLLYAEMVAQSGVECDGFGLEIKTGFPRRGLFCRDLFQISAMLDRFALLGKPVFVTAVACPDRQTTGRGDDPRDGGRWHAPWDPMRQAMWLKSVMHIALSKPFVENVAWADLADLEGQTLLPGSGLLDDMLQPKPAFQMLQELRTKLKPPPRPQPAP